MKDFMRNHLKLLIIIFTVIILGVVLLLVVGGNKNEDIMSIEGSIYTKNDFNMYVYSGKYNLYGKNNTDLPDATLNSKYNDDMTVREFLKKKAVNEMLIAGIVNNLAKENNIEVTNTTDIDEEKKQFIESVGGEKAFKKLLRKNNTSEESYDKMLYTDKLYNLILSELYSDGKKYDLTPEQKKSATNEYNMSYYKISQIVLAKIDLNTNKALSESELKIKKDLADTLLSRIKGREDFTLLAKEYSDDTLGKNDDYIIYFTKNDLLEEIESTTANLRVGEVSNVIETENGYHIIKRLKLDDGALDSFYDKKRDELLLQHIVELQDTTKIIYYDAFEKLEVK